MNKNLDSCLIFNWNEFQSTSFKEDKDQVNLKIYKETIDKPSYRPSEIINKKIYVTNNNPIPICEKKIFGIIDALILQIPKKHLIKKPSVYRQNIIKRCGEEIFTELSKEPFLSLSDNLVTSSYHLQGVNYLIHSALPKYSSNYCNASLSALHLSVRNVLDLCYENKYSSIIIGKDMFNPSELFPINDSIEVVLRTLRCCLEILGDSITKIILCIDDKGIYSNIINQLKIFFPRNNEEQAEYKKYIQPLNQTEYGDLIIPFRNISIRKEFTELDLAKRPNNGYNYHNNKSSPHYYNDLESFEFEENNQQSIDKDKIGRVFKEEVDFAKKFYYDNIIKYNEAIEGIFEEMNFFTFKGTDLHKGQIFFVYLQLIDFYQLDSIGIQNEFLLFNYNYMKMNFQLNKPLSLVFFCKDLEKKNFPTVYIVETIQKMCMSLSTLEHIDTSKIELILFLPGIMFKMYLQFIKFYLPTCLVKNLIIYDTYEDINHHFYLEIDKGIEKRINMQSELNRNKLGEINQIKLIKEANKFKENYFG